ncbi:uncharacterized protein LOC117613032, partial [Prunus dulcis]|uniref:uncharacterized protein LOC117613032 n=1 Tax=Prunus dulcis TaxID=3755 RepID=UPI001482C49C
MIIRDELPFSHVEGIGFHEFLKEAQPRFDLPSRTTIARDGDTIGRLVEACLNGWGIDKVFTISVDNASSNYGCSSYMKKMLEKWNSLIGNGSLLHIRGSSQRLEKFRACLEMENVDTRTMVPLDVCTRWNSTYMMLESAFKLQKGFERMQEDDPNFLGYFEEYEAHGPRYKMEYVEFCLGDLVSDENGVNDMSLEIKTLLNNLLQKFLKSMRDKDVVEIRNEIDKYLLEPPVNLTNDEFKLLDWWKENATKFPILSNVVKDVFAVQASTVALKCSFSRGGHGS